MLCLFALTPLAANDGIGTAQEASAVQALQDATARAVTTATQLSRGAVGQGRRCRADMRVGGLLYHVALVAGSSCDRLMLRWRWNRSSGDTLTSWRSYIGGGSTGAEHGYILSMQPGVRGKIDFVRDLFGEVA